MGAGVGLILIAGGAILTWGVDATVSGLNVTAIGVILLVIGILLVILDFAWWHSWNVGPWSRGAYAEGPPGQYDRRGWPRRRVIVDEDAGPPPGPPGPPGPPPP